MDTKMPPPPDDLLPLGNDTLSVLAWVLAKHRSCVWLQEVRDGPIICQNHREVIF